MSEQHEMARNNPPTNRDVAVVAPGVIDPSMIYSKDEFLRRTGLRPAAYREAKRNGLIVRYKHKRAYILGHDWLDYLQRDDGEIAGESG